MGNKALRDGGTAPTARKQGADLYAAVNNFTDAVVQPVLPRSPDPPRAEDDGLLMPPPVAGATLDSPGRPKLLQDVLSASEERLTPQHSARGSTTNSVDSADSIA
eukprot:EG_transcript_56550